MTSNPRRAEIRVYFATDAGYARAFKLVVDRNGNVYSIQQAWPIDVKHSHHAGGYSRSTMTGVSPHDVDLGGGRPAKVPLSQVKDFVHVTGTNMGGPPQAEQGLRPKSDSRKAGRRSIVLPLPPYMWGIDVWAVANESADLLERLSTTPPYEQSRVSGTYIVDWLDPVLLLVAWETTSPDAYTIYKMTPPPPGELPYIHTPRPYEGTWLEAAMTKQADSES